MKISLIIPAYNEAEKIEKTVSEARKYFEASEYEYEIIVSDDGSSDATVELARKAGARAEGAETHTGKGGAVRRGIELADGAVAVFTDADLPYSLTLIDECVRKIENGAAVVIGDRYDGGYGTYGFMRRVFSRVFAFASNTLLRLNVRDTQCGFKAFDTKTAKELFSRSVINGFGFDTEIIYLARRNGLKIETVCARMLIPPIDSSVKPIRDGIGMLANIFEIRRNDKRGIYGDKKCLGRR